MAKVFTLEECKKHNTESDCWLVMFEKVRFSLGSKTKNRAPATPRPPPGLSPLSR